MALRRHTGQLAVESDGRRYCVAFEGGAIVAASSPVAADAVARIALTNHFITSTQVADLTRRLAMAPDRDEVDVLAESIRFTPDQALSLRHRLVAQRAARTFALERGEFVITERISIPVVPGVRVDHRPVIYQGVRTHVSEQRLVDDLRQLGAQFVLRPEAVEELARYGFEPGARPVLEALRCGTSLPELEASHRELDPRFARAIIYALVSCAACEAQGHTPGERTPPPEVSAPRVALRAPTAPTTPPRLPLGTRPPLAASTPPLSGSRTTGPAPSRPRSASGAAYASNAPDDGTNTPAALRPRTGGETKAPSPSPAARPGAEPRTARPPTLAPPPRTQTPSTPSLASPPAPPRFPVRASNSPPLSAARTETDEGLRFSDLGTPPLRGSAGTAQPAVPRASTPTDAEFRGFADQRTPLGFSEHRTPGLRGTAPLTDPRVPTDPALPRTRTGSPVLSRVSTDNAIAADEACKRGELAMKRDQPGEAVLEFKAACDLHPQNSDYAGMLAWAKFCAAGDKASIGAETRKALERAATRSDRPERARFYLGRVERMLGRDREALRHFQEVLDQKPNHADAASEIRAIEARLQASTKPGLFGRKR